MNRIDVQFLLLAAISLICGVSLGIFMASSQDFQLMPVHAHLNLVGWASLAIFGLTYRAYPSLGRRRLAKVHILFAVPAVVLLPPGIALALLRNFEGLAIVASLLWLCTCLIFLLQLIGLALDKSAESAVAPAE